MSVLLISLTRNLKEGWIMREKELRRSLAVLPMGTVMKLTNLTARQIRYYEEQELVIPERNAGNRRMYSLNDIDKLLEIKDFLGEGINMAGIKHIYEEKAKKEQEKADKHNTLTDADVRRILRDEFVSAGGFMKDNDFSLRNNRSL